MSYLGNGPSQSLGNYSRDTFTQTSSGNTTFTLTQNPVTATAILVFVSGVEQLPTTNYSVSGQTLTFVTAPNVNSVVNVIYLGNLTQTIPLSSVSGVVYPTSPSTNTIPVVTSTNTITYEPISYGLASVSSALIALLHGQCRLSVASATSLTLNRYDGQYVRWNGGVGTIPAAGVSITNSGLSASTNYYVYVYSSTSNGILDTLQLSTTGHSTDTTTGNEGVEIMTGNSARTLVGLIRTNASSQFVDSATQRFCVNWFNQVFKTGFQNIGGSNLTTTSTSFAALSTTILEFLVLSNAPHASGSLTSISSNGTAGATSELNYAVNGSTIGSTAEAEQQASTSGYIYSLASVFATSLSEGYHYGQPYVAVSAGTATYYAGNDTAWNVTFIG
jgi:hypothetical protein